MPSFLSSAVACRLQAQAPTRIRTVKTAAALPEPLGWILRMPWPANDQDLME